MNASERVVFSLCKKVFLSLWTMANPVGKDPSKELCDALVVFGPNVVVISVKDILYKPTENVEVGWKRWSKVAVEKSIKQLLGARRYLESVSRISSRDSSVTFQLPDQSERKYFLMTISLGSNREVPIEVPLPDDEVVHFVDEFSIDSLFGELDTVGDFIEYLEKKQAFLTQRRILLVGAEEDLLGYYLWNNRTFPDGGSNVILDDDIWTGIKERPEYISKKEADLPSFFWDKLIEEFVSMRDPSINSIFGSSDSSNQEFEFAIRTLAMENRFSRRMLVESFWGFHRSPEIESRAVEAMSGVFYVFLKKPIEVDRQTRQAELYARCMVIREKADRDCVVIGIATETDISKGHSLDLIYLRISEFTDTHRRNAAEAREDWQLFSKPRISRAKADEYPKT